MAYGHLWWYIARRAVRLQVHPWWVQITFIEFWILNFQIWIVLLMTQFWVLKLTLLKRSYIWKGQIFIWQWKLSLFYRTEPSKTLALHLTYYSWKYVLIPKQLFYLMHICFAYDSIERGILKQSNLAYLKRKRNGREKGRAVLRSNQITSNLRSCSKWKV